MNIRIKDNQVLFYFSLGIFLIMMLLRRTFYYQYFMGTMYKAILALCVVLLLLNEFLFGNATKRGYISIIVILLLVGLFFAIQVRQYKVMTATAIFVFSARKIPFKNIARFVAILSFAFLVFIIISAYIGIIPNYRGSRGGSARWYLGFLYSLYPATIMTNITFLVIFYRKEKIYWRELLILLLANAFIFYQTDSRLSFIVALLAIIISGFLKRKPDFLIHKKNFTFILSLAFIILALISIVISIKYNSDVEWQSRMNTLLSGRLTLQHQAMQKYGITLMGQDINANGNGLNPFGETPALMTETYFYVDNEYIRWLLSYGIILFLIFIGLFTIVSIKSRKYDKRGYLLIILVLLAIECSIQDSFLNIEYNTFLLAIGNVLIMNQKEKQQEKRKQWIAIIKPEQVK